MNRKNNARLLSLVFSLFATVTAANVMAYQVPSIANSQPKPPAIELISVDDLKAKVARNEPVTIIDVRATDNYADSSTKIKGAIHVKLRKLKYRLGFPPLKNVPRDREVVTYCACPSEEASISAARVLLDSGFKRARALKGGWQEWLKASGPVESKPRGL
jgi:rhodanese-related sulfurtransferase